MCHALTRFLMAALLLALPLGCSDTSPPDFSEDISEDATGADIVEDNPCLNLEEGAVCEDGDPCTLNDSCAFGNCVGAPLECSSENPCAPEECIEGSCVVTSLDEDAPCEDGSLCTEGDTCTNGECTGTPVECAQEPCILSECEPLVGCTATLLPDDLPCEDGDLCTANDACFEGQCVVGPPLECDDLNSCTIDACDSSTGCTNTPNADDCDDGTLCTTDDHCFAAECIGTPLDCDDGDACSLDLCDETGCLHSPANDLECDDSDPCTVADLCVDGTCTPGTPQNCEDGDPCSLDLCDSNGECIHLAGGCDDGDSCTTDVCDGDAGCVHETLNSPLCGNACEVQLLPIADLDPPLTEPVHDIAFAAGHVWIREAASLHMLAPTEAEGLAWVASIPAPPAQNGQLFSAGDLLFLTSPSAGADTPELLVLDVSDPKNPLEVSQWSSGAEETLVRFQLDESMRAIATVTSGEKSSLFHLLDFTDPTAPLSVAFVEPSVQFNDVTAVLHGDLLHIIGNSGGLEIESWSVGPEPSLQNTLSFQEIGGPAPLHAPRMIGDILYLSGGDKNTHWGVTLDPLSTPDTLQSGTFTAHSGHGVLLEDHLIAPGPAGIHAFDVTDPLNPLEVTTLATFPAPDRIALLEHWLLLAATGSPGVHLVDASDPTTLLPGFATGGPTAVQRVIESNETLWVDGYRSITNPVTGETQSTGFTARHDTHNPLEPHRILTIDLPGSLLAVHPTRMVRRLSSTEIGIHAISPLHVNPQSASITLAKIATTFPLLKDAQFLSSGLLAVLTTAELRIYDLATPDEPALVTWTEIHGSHVVIDEDIAFVSTLSNDLFRVDLSDPSNGIPSPQDLNVTLGLGDGSPPPTGAWGWTPLPKPTAAAIEDGWIFSIGSKGCFLHATAIFDPENASIAATYMGTEKTGAFCGAGAPQINVNVTLTSIDVSNGWMVGAAGPLGLALLDMTSPLDPSIPPNGANALPLPGESVEVTFQGPFIHVAQGLAGASTVLLGCQ